MASALIVVDIQNDFLPQGALAVPDGDAVIPVANRLLAARDLVVATKDWHPPDHESFASQHPGHAVGDVIDLHGLDQILWPDHCVQGTPGAEFAPGLETSRFAAVFHKGTDRTIDSYSCFYDNAHRRSTGLGEWLRGRGVKAVEIVGLATDYCVKFSVLDARRLGLETTVVRAGVRAVNLAPGDDERAFAAMREAGAIIA
ncbi:MAG: bifunctional nicotinamidase/pyrazinamidase [Planctomycetota bacterium]|jgi:nicotinamidase/pyrazinamidase